MTGMQIAVALVETAEPHTVRRRILAADVDAAAPFIAAWEALGSTRAGLTEVAWRTLTHPDRQPEVTTWTP